MPQTYNKLVRDRIPEIITAEGRRCAIETMSEAEYQQALLTKLVEEAQEVAGASQEKRAAELADLYEVIEALVQATGLNEGDIRALQAQRRQERGGFEKRIKLLWAE